MTIPDHIVAALARGTRSVLVCGGRSYRDVKMVNVVLDAIDLKAPIALVMQGAATGADECARAWAARRAVACLSVPADWGRLGRAAGPLRNQRMLDDWSPSVVVAFPGGAGTADMVRRARSGRVPVLEVS